MASSRQREPARAESVASETAPAAAAVPSNAGERLSMSERRAGIAVADAAAVQEWPHLREGDKYYTVEAGDVKDGLRPAGSRYEGATQRDPRQKGNGKPEPTDSRKPAPEPQPQPAAKPAPKPGDVQEKNPGSPSNSLGLTEGGPRRRPRRVIS